MPIRREGGEGWAVYNTCNFANFNAILRSGIWPKHDMPGILQGRNNFHKILHENHLNRRKIIGLENVEMAIIADQIIGTGGDITVRKFVVVRVAGNQISVVENLLQAYVGKYGQKFEQVMRNRRRGFFLNLFSIFQ